MASKKEETLENASSGTVDWSVFLQEGVIISLTIKRYRGTTSVNFNELGIDDQSDTKLKSFLDEYIQPGTKRLIPPEIEGQLKSIETSARQNLKDHGFDCTAFAYSGKFVPKSMYAEFKAANEEFQTRFYAIRDEFANNYDQIVDHVRKDYEVLARNLYRQSHPDCQRVPSKYVTTFVDQIIDQIPSSEEIVASFEYSTTLNRIPPHLLNVISKKNNIDEKVMRIAASNQDEKQMIAARKKNQKPADIGDEIAADIAESISSQSEGMADDFITDIQMRIHSDASTGADSIVKSIDKNGGKLVGRASIKAHNLVEELRKMNFYGDPELAAHIDALAEALSVDKTERDIEAVKQAAVDLREWSDKSMSDIHTATVERKTTQKKGKISISSANTRRRTIKQRS